MAMKNTSKFGNSFPRPLRDNPFAAEANVSGGAPIGRRKSEAALLGFLVFSVWNFVALLVLFSLIEWNLSVIRTLGVAVLLSLWQSVAYGVFYARSRHGMVG